MADRSRAIAKRGTWTDAHVRRLFWRAGFGATRAEVSTWTARGKGATIAWLLDGGRGPRLVGPEPRVDGKALDPVNEYGHDVLWWLDQMIRTQRPLVEKMTLFWHNHFATNDQDPPLMLRQNYTFRKYALGNFRRLLEAVTKDPAMQAFLSLSDSDKAAPNENYARELMELFTMGSGYTEQDIREAARALTGFRSVNSGDTLVGVSYDPGSHDAGAKQIFGRSGRFDYKGVLDLVVRRPQHPGFLVAKLWRYFVTEPISPATQNALARVYRRSRLELKPVLKAILGHPALYANLDAPDMVKAPIVYVAGALRTAGRGIDRSDWADRLSAMGQRPFNPPNVAGWEWGPAWMSTNTMRARFEAAGSLIEDGPASVADGSTSPSLSPADALGIARQAVGEPWLSRETGGALADMAAAFFAGVDAGDSDTRQQRADQSQRALRHLLVSNPDGQLH
ncbi:MAG TPA: DUF1800 domain-containing protein [Solirubrobacteraceae bacterium]|nr:DUF1800 domain-containing protein [Solirubrobacteraceae bacterium]